MPFTGQQLHSSTTSGKENNRFQLFFEPLTSIEEASPQVNGSVPQGQRN